MLWLRGDPSQLPCFQTNWDAANFEWINGKHIRMTAPLPNDGNWHAADDNIYQLHVIRTGAFVEAYFIQANSVLPISGNWIIRHFDMPDALAIKSANKGSDFDFEIEWDVSRQRTWDEDLASEVENAPLTFTA